MCDVIVTSIVCILCNMGIGKTIAELRQPLQTVIQNNGDHIEHLFK